jgi:putative glutamine amidotransferase
VTALVAVTAPRRTDAGRERVVLNTAYVRALDRAGLVPLVLPTLLDPARAAVVLAAARGLVLTGGEDVDPARYGASPHAKLGSVDPHRDAVEIALLTAARARRLPVLAICRGIQVLNVAFGGTLFQDLASERPGSIPHDGGAQSHPIDVEVGSLLHRTLGERTPTVNSRHHQAINDLSPELRVVARAPDGVVEGVELAHPNDQWLLGVQWHPEDMTETALFRGFAQAVG